MRTLAISLVVLAFFAEEAQCAIINWTNIAGGNWSQTNNWSPHQLPGSSDTAVITNNGNYVVSLDTNASVGGLLLGSSGGGTQILSNRASTFTLFGQAVVNSGGQFDIKGGTFNGGLEGGVSATLQGKLTFSGGVLSGTLTVATNGVIDWIQSTILNVLGSGPITLTNYGVVTWTGGYLYAQAGCVVDNYGLWDAQSDYTFQGNGAIFNNYGTFRKSGTSTSESGGAGTTDFDSNTTFNNAGTVDVQTATVEFDGPGVGTGVFNTTNGAETAFGINQPARYTLTGDPTFTGPGKVIGYLISSNAVLHGTLNAAGIMLSGTLTVATNGAIDWIQSTIFNVLGFGPTILTNYGIVTWSGGDLFAQTGCVVDNYGLWDAQSDYTFQGNGAIFNNYGTLRKSGGTATTDFDSNTTFNNAGTVDVQTAVVEFDGPGVGSGVFNTTNGATTAFQTSQGSGYILAGDPTFAGPGNVIGYLNSSNAVLHGTLVAAGIALSGTLTVATNGVIDWMPSGIFNVLVAGPTILTNYGVVTWSGGDLFAQTGCVVDNYGLWDAQSDNFFHGGGGAIFNNYGTLRKSGGTGTTDFDSNTTFNNAGTVDVQTAVVEFDGPGVGSGVFNTTNGATTAFQTSQGSGYILAGNPTFTGPGNVIGYLNGSNAVLHGTLVAAGIALSGTLTVATNGVIDWMPSGIFNVLASGPTTLTNYGVVTWSGGDLFDLYAQAGMMIDNYGLWDAQSDNFFYGGGGTIFNNYGTFRKSSGTGTTDFDSNTTFNNAGTVDVQAAVVEFDGTNVLTGGTLNFGINSSTSFGSIKLAGNAVLTGTLSANLNHGYSPVASNSFALLTYGSETGTFTSLNLPHLPSTLLWQANYGTTAFTLNVATAPPLKLSQVTEQNGTNFSFAWNGLSGQTYQVQYTTSLAPADWINLGGTISGTNGTMTVSDLIGPDLQRFYRLVILP